MLAIELYCCCYHWGKPNALNEYCDSGQAMIMSHHNQHHLITFSLSLSNISNSDTTAKLNLMLIV